MKARLSDLPHRAAAFVALSMAAIGSVPAAAQLAPEETARHLKVPAGLEATLWAAEPMLMNPTNIDVDSRGRVWVCEAVNYRSTFKPWGYLRPEGDRILILEDTDHDGRADKQTVFYQSPKLQSPLGITVLGDKVIVAQSPNLMVFQVDASGDKPVGDPKIILSGFGGIDHDHGVHSGVVGPDGRYYLNAGNFGMEEALLDADGKPVTDSTGSQLGNKAKQFRGHDKAKGEIGYIDGTAFRAEIDASGSGLSFSRFETLGYNFRNPFELTVDSFGTVWQSDNDDDGNQAVRMLYVMEGGNFGYKGPKGFDWKRDASAFPGQSKQESHWHLRWPGVTPSMLFTGAGSPTGITVYEGELLPEKFHGALIHCDAGPNVVHAYTVHPSNSAPTTVAPSGEVPGILTPGAGYAAASSDLVTTDDKWFRPSDVCVGPDGSLYIADWYDPGVGGHKMDDKDAGEEQPTPQSHLRGRIYRVAPAGHHAPAPKLDLSTPAGQIAALKSPNFATRYLGYAGLRTGGEAAQKVLEPMFHGDANPRMRARALWLLAKTDEGKQVVETALKDPDENLRITALRAARQAQMDVPAVARSLLSDSSMGVLREVALAMNPLPAEQAVPILVKLAERFDGNDRWFLEALGIGAGGKEDAFLAAWKEAGHDVTSASGERLAWRMKKVDPTAKPPGGQPKAGVPAADKSSADQPASVKPSDEKSAAGSSGAQSNASTSEGRRPF